MTIDDSNASGTASKVPTYGLILQGPESTVCAEAPAVPAAEEAYQSEAALESELISILTSQGTTGCGSIRRRGSWRICAPGSRS